ncbi:MAG: hypothetical protein U1E62_08435 [Alsobacter sp.]
MRPIRMLNASFTMAALAAMVATAPLPAQAAQGRNAAAAAGAVGGLALGAALGAAASQPRTVTSPGGMIYEERGPVVSDEECMVTRQRVWVDGYGWRVVRREVCE